MCGTQLPLFCLLIVVVVSVCAAAETYRGTVVGVSDGDTITLLVDSRQIKVRLASIDAPERGQPFGTRARERLAKLTFQREATVIEVSWDRYGRLVGQVRVDGLDVNAQLVREGYVWVYRKYSDDPQLLRLESQARDEGRGIWSLDEHIPPWEWRRGLRAASSTSEVESGTVLGNRRSKIYHLAECPDYLKIAEHNRVPFADEDAAKSEGYRKAGNCP